MQARPILAGLAVVCALVGCQRSPKQLASGLSVASQPPPSSLLRLPADGGMARVYRLPGFGATEWASATPLPPLRRTIGANLDEGTVYLLGKKGEISVLDLQTGRVRQSSVTDVREVAMGPDGALFAVNDSLYVTQIVRRNPVRFTTRLKARPSDLFGTKDDQLLALASGPSTTLAILGANDAPVVTTLPRGDAAATFWGDLVAIAADSAVILYDPRSSAKPRIIPVEGHARAVVFSPSGHRLYVATRDRSILVWSRYDDEWLGELELPGPAGALRADPFGRWLLVHPPSADSVWVVDLATGRYRGGFPSEWASDVPTVTNQQILLTKSGGDLVGYDLSAPKLPQAGRVKGGADDFWLPVAWTPESGTEPPASTETPAAEAEDSAAGPAPVYLQVSSSQNRGWAAELARQLSDAGLPASVRNPGQGEEGYRVVLGPYPSRDEAEAAGKKLGRPFFIYQPRR